MYLNFIPNYFQRTDRPRKILSQYQYSKIYARLVSKDQKVSTSEIENKLNMFSISLSKAPKTYKAESPEGIENKARVEGEAYLQFL